MMFLPELLLWLVGFLVPSRVRDEWLREWRGELWHVRKTGFFRALRFTFGSLYDALWLRRNQPFTCHRRSQWLGSPSTVVYLLIILLAVSCLSAIESSRLPDRLLLSPYTEPARLALISPVSRLANDGPSIALRDYTSLSSRSAHIFSDLAYYRPQTFLMQRSEGSESLTVAVSTLNLFSILQLSPPLNLGSEEGGTLILSENYWRRRLGSDPDIVGRRLRIGERNLRVSAILPSAQWRLPGKVDAWWLQSSIEQTIDREAAGFVLAQLRDPGESWFHKTEWRVLVPDGNGGFARLSCESLAKASLLRTHALVLLVAFMLFPVAFSLSLDRYPTSWAAHGFLGLKLALLIPAVFFAFASLTSISAPEIQPHGLMAAYLLAMRWALIDQRSRCPVCLHQLEFPTRIGQSSQTFLDWYGTELACSRGHGLLHVPEVHSSCYGGRQWLPLDASWRGLFTQTEPKNIL